MMFIESVYVTGQKVLPSMNLSGPALILTGHCLLTGHYFEPGHSYFLASAGCTK